MTHIEHPSDRIESLVSQLIDGDFSADQTNVLCALVQSDSHRLDYVIDHLLLDSLLADELGRESLTALVDLLADEPVCSAPSIGKRRVARAAGMLSVVVASFALSLAVVFLWHMVGETPASAAAMELNRIIAASSKPADRAYQITVEEAISTTNGEHRPKLMGPDRPPKPPLEGAILFARGERQFVLKRMTTAGLPFVTGSNGKTSWAVRPDGPVRVSSDLTRFNRDVPGHEHSMSLINIHDSLEQLREAYDIRLLPIENPEERTNVESGAIRLIVAVKNRGYRGPRRVEISYSVRDGLIQQLRFIEMPYGPERLTLRMTLMEEQDLGATFFDHESHHSADRKVEVEE